VADRITPLVPPPPAEARQEPVPGTYVPPWHRQPGEPEAAYLKFKDFLDAPRPRRLIRPGVGHTQSICDLSNEWRWHERVEAYDTHWQRVRDREVESFIKQEAREIAAEHMAVLRDLRELVAIHVERKLKDARTIEISDAKLSDLARLVDLVIKGDRLIRGESTENHAKVADLSGLTLEELRAAEDLAAKLEAGENSPKVH